MDSKHNTSSAVSRFLPGSRSFDAISRGEALFARKGRRTKQSKMATIGKPVRKRRRVGSASASSTAKLALSKVRRMERKQEVKVFDVLVNAIAGVGSTGDIRSLALMSQGNLVSQRQGDSIAPFFLKVRLSWAGVAASTIDVYRTIIFRDMRQVVSTVPTVSQVLSSNSPLSQFNVINRTRFKILFDRTFTIHNDVGILPVFVAIMNIKLRLSMSFSGAATTSIKKNGLFMLNISNVGANEPTVTFGSRLLYNDS